MIELARLVITLPHIVSIRVIEFLIEVDDGWLRGQRDASSKD